MCAFTMCWLYLLVAVGTQATVIHDRYIHDNEELIFKHRFCFLS